MLPHASVTGDWYLISKIYRLGRGVKVGDVVTYDSTVEPGVKVTKRVVGLQGNYVMRYSPDSGNEGMVQVSWFGMLIGMVAEETKVPQGHCWVVGDNMDASRDSRLFGPVPLALIRGKHIAKVLPWSERRWLENPLRPVKEGTGQKHE
jgi:mitochondrial inner membrane protease subunit 1